MRLKLCRVTAPYRLPDRAKSTAESIPTKVRTEGLGHETAVWTDACSSPERRINRCVAYCSQSPARSEDRGEAFPASYIGSNVAVKVGRYSHTSQTGSSRMPRDAAISARVDQDAVVVRKRAPSRCDDRYRPGSWYRPTMFPPGSRMRAVISGASAPMGCTMSPPFAITRSIVTATLSTIT